MTGRPPEGIAICGALFTSRCRIYVKYYPRPARFRLHPHLIDPSMRPSTHAGIELHESPFRHPKDAQRQLYSAAFEAEPSDRNLTIH